MTIEYVYIKNLRKGEKLWVHNKTNLMAELEKIIRVLKKQDEAVPHSTLLVLDATTGQNAFERTRGADSATGNGAT